MAKNKIRPTAPQGLIKNLVNRATDPSNLQTPLLTEESERALLQSGMLANEPALEAGLDLVCKISDTLIFYGWIQDSNESVQSVTVAGCDLELVTRLHRYDRPEINIRLGRESDDHYFGFLFMVPAAEIRQGGSVKIETANAKKVLNYQLAKELNNNQVFKDYFSEMLTLAEEQGFDGVYSLMSKYAVPAKNTTSIHAAVDYCYLLAASNALFVTGWAFSSDADIVSAHTTIEGRRYDLYKQVTLIPRDDLKHGFTEIGNKSKTAGYVNCLKLTASELPAKLLIKFTASNKDTFVLEVIPKKLDDRIEFSKLILNYIDISKDGFKKMFDEYLGYAIQNGLAEYDKSLFKLKSQTFGIQVSKPKVTVIVPIYGRIDFIKYQLSQFADDQDFRENVELIYVLDDPNLENIFFRYCADQAPLFNVPFKAISYGMNLGYAGANNVAARIATGDHLILLNSDVLPDSNGWVSHLLNHYQSLSDVGALAPKLLYEDGSIQHAGMVFERFAALDGMWSNLHPGKGMPDTEVASKNPIAVSAVTGACLMISKVLYDKVDGLSEQYFLGDFEDSDLCLKLFELGKKSYYAADLHLYHLERQSQSLFENTDWKAKVTFYNCWQHTQRWNELICKINGDS